jgi:hypothetical protein
LTDYNDAAINAGLEAIKTKAAEVPELKALILQHPYNATSSDTDDGFDTLLTCLFAYPLMDLFHLCLIDAFKTGRISPENRDKVLKAYDTL